MTCFLPLQAIGKLSSGLGSERSLHIFYGWASQGDCSYDNRLLEGRLVFLPTDLSVTVSWCGSFSLNGLALRELRAPSLYL